MAALHVTDRKRLKGYLDGHVKFGSSSLSVPASPNPSSGSNVSQPDSSFADSLESTPTSHSFDELVKEFNEEISKLEVSRAKFRLVEQQLEDEPPPLQKVPKPRRRPPAKSQMSSPAPRAPSWDHPEDPHTPSPMADEAAGYPPVPGSPQSSGFPEDYLPPEHNAAGQYAPAPAPSRQFPAPQAPFTPPRPGIGYGDADERIDPRSRGMYPVSGGAANHPGGGPFGVQGQPPGGYGPPGGGGAGTSRRPFVPPPHYPPAQGGVVPRQQQDFRGGVPPANQQGGNAGFNTNQLFLAGRDQDLDPPEGFQQPYFGQPAPQGGPTGGTFQGTFPAFPAGSGPSHDGVPPGQQGPARPARGRPPNDFSNYPLDGNDFENPRTGDGGPGQELSGDLSFPAFHSGQEHAREYPAKGGPEQRRIINDFIDHQSRAPGRVAGSPDQPRHPGDEDDLSVESVQFGDDLSSERLADIFVEQGKYHRAVEIYQALSKKNPLRRDHYLNLIQQLSNQ